MSKEAIIDKILSDASSRAEAMVGEAYAKADAILAQTAEQCKTYLAQSKSETDKLIVDIANRSATVAELDAKKLQLAAKSQILDKVFARALEKARNLDKKRYSKLILGMLAQSEDGDIVTISDREKDIITDKVVKAEAEKRGIKLSLAKQKGDFDGGVIFSGKGVDKNFTLEVELSILRDAMETQIAKEIFG